MSIVSLLFFIFYWKRGQPWGKWWGSQYPHSPLCLQQSLPRQLRFWNSSPLSPFSQMPPPGFRGHTRKLVRWTPVCKGPNSPVTASPGGGMGTVQCGPVSRDGKALTQAVSLSSPKGNSTLTAGEASDAMGWVCFIYLPRCFKTPNTKSQHKGGGGKKG